MVVLDLLTVIASYQSLDKLVKNLEEDDFKFLKKEFPDKWQYLNKKLA